MIQNNQSFNYLVRSMHIIIITSLFTCLYSDALPGEFYSTQRWRDLLSNYSPATNPAFILEENHTSIRAAFAPTMESSFFLTESGITVPIGLYQSAGLSYLGLSTNESIIETKSTGNPDKPIEAVSSLNDFHNLFIFSYAINPFNRLGIGMNVNILHDNNFGDALIGLGLDCGLSYRIIRHPLLGDHVLGLSFQNILSPYFYLNSKRFNATNLKLSWIAKVWENRIDIGMDIDIKDLTSFKNSMSNPEDIEFEFNSRIGTWLFRMLNAYVQLGPEYWGLSGGMNIPTLNDGRDMQVAYQFLSLFHGDIAKTHTFYIRTNIGKHREEIYAKKMARLANLTPNDLYIKSMMLFSKKKYWEAFFIFGKILTEYNDFFKNDWVKFYAGLCLEKMDMREYASLNYSEMIKNYPRSEVIHHAHLGQLRLHYRNGNDHGLANTYAILTGLGVPDSLKNQAHYYSGQNQLQNKNYRLAIKRLSIIPENHPEFLFARHSIGIAHILMNEYESAVDVFGEIIQISPKTNDEAEIIQRTFVFLGYIFYENLIDNPNSLSNAVTFLRRVDEGSIYYEDALLGLAWTAVKARNWIDCRSAAAKITSMVPRPILQCEAALLEAYCLINEKRFARAARVLEEAKKEVSTISLASQGEVIERKNELAMLREDYCYIAAIANELAYSSQPPLVKTKIDSIETYHREAHQKIKDHIAKDDKISRNLLFGSNLKTLRDDIEYVHAKIHRMANDNAVNTVVKDTQYKQNEIDQDIQKLNEKLNKLETKEIEENDK